MSTITRENYLKALYFLSEESKSVSLTELGKAMKVSKPTAYDMVRKLQSNGWITYKKYKPISLTEEGSKAAAIVVRRHRLAEMFLYQIMRFGWEEVHDIAEELEHINSELFFDRMDEIMGFPTVDPHGSPIPDKEGNYNKPNYQLLSKISENTKVKLKALRDSSTEFLLFLNDKNLQLNDTIHVHKIERFDKSIVISYNKHSEVVISNEVANRLLVEKE